MGGKGLYRILVVNPGSTSTKIAVYENETEKHREEIEHTREQLGRYKAVADQFRMRKEAVMAFLAKIGYSDRDFDAVVGRGGLLPPVKAGAYRVNDLMLRTLRENPRGEHASNLGALIAFEIAQPAGKPSYVYDSVAVDEVEEIARFTGLDGVTRKSLIHALNMRAMALEAARRLKRPYKGLCLLVAHLGGGVTLSLHRKGRMVDFVGDNEGPFSPERAGRMPVHEVVDLCFSGKYDAAGLKKTCRGRGGLFSLLGTADAREVEKRIAEGDGRAKLVYSAMAYQIAKGLGELAAAADGKVDRIVLTGGLAHSRLLTGWIRKKVRFIAPVMILPGENELRSLALGGLRVLRGQEKARDFDLS